MFAFGDRIVVMPPHGSSKDSRMLGNVITSKAHQFFFLLYLNRGVYLITDGTVIFDEGDDVFGEKLVLFGQSGNQLLFLEFS